MAQSYLKFNLFVAQSIDDCTRNGVTVHFSHEDRVDGCMGYYNNPDLYVAMKYDNWRAVYIHEYCHFLQDLDERACKDPGYRMPSMHDYNKWLQFTFKKKYPVRPKWLTRVRRLIQGMESNCDKRAAQLILDYGFEEVLPHAEYVKRANVYHLFYTFLDREVPSGGWYSVPPYSIPELIDMVPGDHILTPDELEVLPLGFVEIVKEKCMKTEIDSETV